MLYVGLRSIAKRMQWKAPQTVLRNYQYRDFPIVRRQLAHGRWCYITDDILIVRWLERQWVPHVVGKKPRRQYKTCVRCGETMLVPGQSYHARTFKTIERITSTDDPAGMLRGSSKDVSST